MTRTRSAARPGWFWVTLAAHLALPPLTALTLVSAWQLGAGPASLGAAIAASLALHLGLALTGRRPRVGYAATALAMLVLVLTPFPGWTPSVLPSSLCFLLALCWFTAIRPFRESVIALAIAAIGIGITEFAAWRRMQIGEPGWIRAAEGLLLLLISTGGWFLARLARLGQASRQRTERERLTTAIADERASIRRDLHDVIAHTVTVMVARIEAAAVTTTDPATRNELAGIAETGRDAHAGLRAMLGTLGPGGAKAAAPISLDSLADLVATSSSRFHRVTLTEAGERRPLTLSGEVAVVRMVQESVTNALRHLEPPVLVAVELSWRGAEVVAEVRDDGGAGRRPGTGRGTGLLGIEERVRATGGSLLIERPERGGWRITARIPTKALVSEDER